MFFELVTLKDGRPVVNTTAGVASVRNTGIERLVSDFRLCNNVYYTRFVPQSLANVCVCGEECNTFIKIISLFCSNASMCIIIILFKTEKVKMVTLGV